MFVFASILVLLLYITGCSFTTDHDKVEKAYIDISNWDQHESTPLLLNGKWEFYYNKLLNPDDFAAHTDTIVPDSYIRVPGTWKGTEINGEPVSGQGSATYRLIINDEKGHRSLGVKIKAIGTSYRFYLNGRVISQVGITGMSYKEYIPQFKPLIIPVNLVEGKNEIVINVSNYDDLRGGIWDPIIIDDFSQLQTSYIFGTAIGFMIFGSLLFAGIYHIFVYLSRRKDLFILYLSFFCIVISLFFF